jgi:hypothetical protein
MEFGVLRRRLRGRVGDSLRDELIQTQSLAFHRAYRQRLAARC